MRSKLPALILYTQTLNIVIAAAFFFRATVWDCAKDDSGNLLSGFITAHLCVARPLVSLSAS